MYEKSNTIHVIDYVGLYFDVKQVIYIFFIFSPCFASLSNYLVVDQWFIHQHDSSITAVGQQ